MVWNINDTFFLGRLFPCLQQTYLENCHAICTQIEKEKDKVNDSNGLRFLLVFDNI